MQILLRTEALTKRFGKRVAVDNVFLEIYEGDIYGFLGLNGAGKTTTIRMLLNLVEPSRGKVFIFGKPLRNNFVEIMRDVGVGALVENPTFYPYLSAYKNLEILRIIAGNTSIGRIEEVLEMVGLTSRMHDKVRTYSQGMKQRLGIAQAILGGPRFCILDEPTNGLDPEGINHIRSLIKELNRKSGTTFLISSHLLHEIEIMCNRVGVIHNGKLFVQDSVDKLLASNIECLKIKVLPAQIQKAKDIIRKKSWVKKLEGQEDGSLTVKIEGSSFADLNTELVGAGINVSEFTPVRIILESYFLEKFGGQKN